MEKMTQLKIFLSKSRKQACPKKMNALGAQTACGGTAQKKQKNLT